MVVLYVVQQHYTIQSSLHHSGFLLTEIKKVLV
jgi:hypothetical protein